MKPLQPSFKVQCCSLLLLVFGLNASAQTQLGNDIDGEAIGDYSGHSVSMPDPFTVAIGAVFYHGTDSGSKHVRVFRWDGYSWEQKGSSIGGSAIIDSPYVTVCMPDSNTVAIGAHHNTNTAFHSGLVQVYLWNGSSWVQKGGDLFGDAVFDHCGYSISMPDPNTIAVGCQANESNNNGRARIYNWSNEEWIQKGITIDEGGGIERSVYSISMPDINTVGIGAILYDSTAVCIYRVNIFTWDGFSWNQEGNNIDESLFDDGTGLSISMPSSNTLAVGIPLFSTIGWKRGQARIYDLTDGDWVLRGSPIDGTSQGERSGFAVSMPNDNVIAIGSPYRSPEIGRVRVFVWNGAEWTQPGLDINGESPYDLSGTSVSMPDVNTVAIGAPNNYGNGFVSGQVRVYSLSIATTTENTFGSLPTIHPNPNNGRLTLDLGTDHSSVSVTVREALGREVSSNNYGQEQFIELEIEGAPGIYFLDIVTGDNATTLKVVKE